MAEKKSKLVKIKTQQTSASVDGFLNKLTDEQQRKDSLVLLEMMKKASKEEPKLWGNAMIGFGKVIYKSPATGREVEWMRIGFSPRKGKLSLHLMMDINKNPDLKKLGKFKTGVGCLYINKLEDVDMKVLKGMIDGAVKDKGKKSQVEGQGGVKK